MNLKTTGIGRRTLAFARRAWIQQGRTVVWLSALVGAGFGVLVFFATGGVNGVPGTTDMIPAQVTDLVSVRDSEGDVQVMTSYMLAMAPALLGTLVGIVATLTLPGVVADDVSGGGIEVLLASPIPRRALFQSYLSAGLILAVVSWLIASLSFGTVIAAISLSLDASLTVTFPYLAALIVLPLSMGIWSATATLFGALLYPESLETRAGMNGGPIRLLALAPSLLALSSALVLSSWLLPALVAVLAVTVLASAFLVRLTARGFRSSRVLGS